MLVIVLTIAGIRNPMRFPRDIRGGNGENQPTTKLADAATGVATTARLEAGPVVATATRWLASKNERGPPRRALLDWQSACITNVDYSSAFSRVWHTASRCEVSVAPRVSEIELPIGPPKARG
jgi:hypothetical protein